MAAAAAAVIVASLYQVRRGWCMSVTCMQICACLRAHVCVRAPVQMGGKGVTQGASAVAARQCGEASWWGPELRGATRLD
jgi:hypothetical protein